MAGPDSSHGISRVVHHKDFYLRGGDMTVLVENHLYRIHSYFFERESPFFRQKLIAAHNNGDDERGLTDKDAYTLEDVKSEDFARFLWVFYNPKYSVYEAPLETWLSILKLANRWTFDNVKELSVRELEKIEIEPVEKIAIYHDNNISRLYLIPSYIDVCKRDKPLTFSEGMKLGMETVLRIAEARERMRLQASESGIRTPTFEDFEDSEVEALIREIFNLGIRSTSSTSPATSPASGFNGALNGTIKLSPAPPGNPPKANGASAPRANGGSAADPKGSLVDSMPSIASIISSSSSQRPSTPVQPLAAPAPSTAQQEQRAPVPPVKPAPLAPVSQPQGTPSTADKPKDSRDTAPQESHGPLSALMSPKSGGAAAHSNLSQAEADKGAGSDDVSLSKPVVPSSEHNDDVTESNDNVNDAENDPSGKDNDTASVFSENDGGRGGKQGGRGKKGTKTAGGAGRGKKNRD